MSLLSRRIELPISALALIASLATAVTLLKLLQTPPHQKPQILKAPPTTTTPPPSHLYPPTALPGGRSVPTPWGTTRAYEWGPPTGRRVLLIHGISTPCIALAGLAQDLVARQGCRVLVFDLFGRGYSDAPAPERCPQDEALWCAQILSVLVSSEVDWSGGCTVVGYSLGGGIAAAFAEWFPALVEGLVLVAPSGVMRGGRVGWGSRLLYGGWLPWWVVVRMVRGRLGGGAPPKQEQERVRLGPGKAVEGEVPDDMAVEEAVFPGRPGFSVMEAVGWQMDAHPGFFHAFVSSIRHSPITGQHDRWRRLGERYARRRASPDSSTSVLKEDKVLILLGREDSVVVPDEVGPDAVEAFGRENAKAVTLEGGHDLPIVNSRGCGQTIADFWEKRGEEP